MIYGEDPFFHVNQPTEQSTPSTTPSRPQSGFVYFKALSRIKAKYNYLDSEIKLNESFHKAYRKYTPPSLFVNQKVLPVDISAVQKLKAVPLFDSARVAQGDISYSVQRLNGKTFKIQKKLHPKIISAVSTEGLNNSNNKQTRSMSCTTPKQVQNNRYRSAACEQPSPQQRRSVIAFKKLREQQQGKISGLSKSSRVASVELRITKNPSVQQNSASKLDELLKEHRRVTKTYLQTKHNTLFSKITPVT